MKDTFRRATAFNGYIGSWDTSRVLTFRECFAEAKSFSQDISGWNVTAAHDFAYMFHEASSFNTDLSPWKPSNAVAVDGMFFGAIEFDQNLCAWEELWKSNYVMTKKKMFSGTKCPVETDPMITKVAVGPLCHYCTYAPCFAYQCQCFEHSRDLFRAVKEYLHNDSPYTAVAKTYGHVIGRWCTKHIKSFDYLFDKAVGFDENLCGWDVSSATSMEATFRRALSFNHPLSCWDVSRVETFRAMFQGSRYDQPLLWNTSSATNMHKMFTASQFDHPLNWDVSKVEDFSSAFRRSSFNHSLSSWQVEAATDLRYMFAYATSYDQDLCAWTKFFPKSD